MNSRKLFLDTIATNKDGTLQSRETTELQEHKNEQWANTELASFTTLKVWRASSRVGAMRRARVPFVSRFFSFWSIGITKAAVLPLPVLDMATISLPSTMHGIAFLWIGVGWRYPFFSTPLNTAWSKPKNISKDCKKNTHALPSSRSLVFSIPRLTKTGIIFLFVAWRHFLNRKVSLKRRRKDSDGTQKKAQKRRKKKTPLARKLYSRGLFISWDWNFACAC